MSDILKTGEFEVAIPRPSVVANCYLRMSDILKAEVALLSLKPVVCRCKTANTFYVAIDYGKYAQPCTLFGSLSYESDMLITAL